MANGQSKVRAPNASLSLALGLVMAGCAGLCTVGCAGSAQDVTGDQGWTDTPIASPTANGSGRRNPAQIRREARRAANPDLIKAWRNGATGDRRLPAILTAAEAHADPAGRHVLRTGRGMVQTKEVVRGSCWTYASAVYKHAGFVGRGRSRPYKTKRSGPYADADELQAGDFLSYVNLQYKRGLHSAIFVAWLDRGAKEALMLSYVGSRRAKPGDYRSYTLSHVYMIQRPVMRSRPADDVWDGGDVR